nr:MAG TPA: Large Terminase [Caudoviricetes sp.]
MSMTREQRWLTGIALCISMLEKQLNKPLHLPRLPELPHILTEFERHKMTLSNTATPKYYGEFRDRVLRGEIPVPKTIEMEMNRIDALIASPRYYYDDTAIDGFIKYCEDELTLVDGGDFKMLDTFKLWAESLLAWFYYETVSEFVPDETGHHGKYVQVERKRRLINKQYLIVGRGAAKSMYMSFIHAYFLNIDPSSTHQIATAPTMPQAEETLSPLKTAIVRSKGPYFKLLTSGLVSSGKGGRAQKTLLDSTKRGIENFSNSSLLEVRPMSVDKLQGLRSKINTVDEWLSGDVRQDVIAALEQGASKIQDWVVLAVSSEGTARNGVGDSIKMELMSILKGDYYDPHTSIWYYRLDNVEEVGDPNMWMKAQPNIGATVSYETYQRDVARAENVPSARNDILAKRFGIPMEGYTYFFPYEETLVHPIREYWQMPCAMGADLSQGDDFCAFTFLFPLGDGSFGVKTRAYITVRTFDNLPSAGRIKYEEFIREGSLHVMEGVVLDMMEVYNDLDEYILKSEYDVRAFGYDPYNAREFVERWVGENGPYGVQKVIQGAKTESVPLGELKALSENRMLLFDQELMGWAMGNTITLEDTNGNRKILKKRMDLKIDSVAAMVDAWVAYKANSDDFR